jgi:hypothetical protein
MRDSVSRKQWYAQNWRKAQEKVTQHTKIARLGWSSASRS